MKKTSFAIVLIILILLFASSCSTVTKFSFEQEEIIVAPQTAFTPLMKISPKSAEYTLSVANETIATVAGNKITALREGRTTITARAGEKTAKATLVVSSDVSPNKDQAGRVTYRTVTFLITDGTRLHTMEIKEGTAPGFPNISAKAGYEIDGWYKDAKLENKFNFDLPIQSDVTVYGKYKLLPATFVFEAEGEDSAIVSSLAFPLNPYEELIFPSQTPLGVPVVGVSGTIFKGDSDKIEEHMGNATVKRVVIPASYKEISSTTFCNFISLEEVVFAEGSRLERIGIAAFRGCSKLKTLTLPASVVTIDSYAFYNCSQLNITSLPAGVDKLTQYSFANTAIVSADLKNISTILEGAFFGCTKLETVTNTQNVTRVYKNAFSSVKAVKTGSDTNKGIRTVGGIVVGIAASTVKTTLDTQSVTLFADGAFTDANVELVLYLSGNPTALIFESSGVFRDSMAIVVKAEFYEQTRESLVWSTARSLLCREVKIGQFTLLHHFNSAREPQNWYSLLKYTEKGDSTDPETVDLSEITVDNETLNITKIKAGAFTQLKKLKILKLSASITSIEDYAVNGNDSLIAVFAVGNTAAKLDGAYSIAKGNNGYGALKIYVPDSRFGHYLEQWSALRSLINPQSIVRDDGLCIWLSPRKDYAVVVQYIGSEKNIVIPETVTIAIDEKDEEGNDIKVFKQFAVKEIGGYAFAANSSVESIVIPQSVNQIKAYAIVLNNNLTTIEFLGGEDTALKIASPFLNVADGITNIFIPAGSKAFYEELMDSVNENLTEKLTERA